MGEEERSAEMYENHIKTLFDIFKGYFNHADMKKRVCFSEIFVFMASEIKKITDKLSPELYSKLRSLVRQIMSNIFCESDAFSTCMVSVKKLILLRIFVDET